MDIWNFLVPDTSLDWFFFILLLLWMFLSLGSVRLARLDIDKQLASSHFKNINAGVHDLSVAVRSRWDFAVDNGPGVALVLGLLGTFLGIGLAIQHGAEILDRLGDGASATDLNQAVGQLSPMLQEIGLKFRSSTWGICVHIALRLIIPRLGLEEFRHQEILKEMEADALEKRKLEEQNAKNLTQIKELGEKRVKYTANMLALLDRLVKAQEGFAGNVDKLGNTVEELKGTIVNFSKEMGNSITEMNDGVGQAVHQISSSVAGLQDSLAVELKTIAKVTSDLKTHSSTMTTVIKDQSRVFDEVTEKMQTITSNGAQYATGIADFGEAFTEKGQFSKKLDKLVEESQSSNKAITDRLDLLVQNGNQLVLELQQQDKRREN